jgi:hypothetical protein
MNLVRAGTLPFHAVTSNRMKIPKPGDPDPPRAGKFSSPDALSTPSFIAQAARDSGIRIEPAWKVSIVYGMPCAIYHQLPAAYCSPTILKTLFCTRLTVAARTWLGHVLPVHWSVHRSDWELSPKGSSKGSRDMMNSPRCVSGWASWRNGDAKRATKPIKVKEHERARTPSTDSGSGDCPVPLDVFRTGPGALGPLSCSHLPGQQ